MNYGHYTTQTVSETVALANALANHPDDPPSEDALRELLHRFELPTSESLDVLGLTHLAQRLRSVFTAPETTDKVAVLNDMIALYQPSPRIVDHDGQGHHMHYVPPDAGHLRAIGASMTMALALVLCDYGAGRFGSCASCGDVFVDTTRNGRQRFCSRSCANRVHVASHRARASGTADG
jgi:predicted RNA-binding Zn ribbon-like protein